MLFTSSSSNLKNPSSYFHMILFYLTHFHHIQIGPRIYLSIYVYVSCKNKDLALPQRLFLVFALCLKCPIVPVVHHQRNISRDALKLNKSWILRPCPCNLHVILLHVQDQNAEMQTTSCNQGNTKRGRTVQA